MVNTATINLKDIPYLYKNKKIYISEKNVPVYFSMIYFLISDRTGDTKRFNFECSTGPESDPKTEWVYKSDEGIRLHICPDTEIQKKRNRLLNQ